VPRVDVPGLLAGRLLAGLAILIALAAPFWFDAALGLLGLQTPAESRFAATRARAAAEAPQIAALERQIEAARAQLARSRADAAQIKLSSWSSIYALTDLIATLRQAEPFGEQFAVASAVTGLPDDIGRLLDQLGPYAAIGVPGAARINRDFASRAARLGWSGPSSAPVAVVRNLLAWSEQQLSGGAAPVDDTSHRLAQASAQLAANDIAAAVDTVGGLEGPARENFSDWLQDATARAAADRLARRVNLMLAAGRPAAPPPPQATQP
jgi:hypothetical protein